MRPRSWGFRGLGLSFTRIKAVLGFGVGFEVFSGSRLLPLRV